ncbi:hypothetical protein HDU91_000572, partial [Kappamyces sp. JEL0680]
MIGQILASLAISASAAPSVVSPAQHDLHYLNRREAKQPFFYPQVATKDYPMAASSLAPLADQDAVALGKAEVVKELGLGDTDLQVVESHRDNAGVMHVYLKRVINGHPVDNQNAAVHVKNGQVVYMSHSLTSSKAKRSVSAAAPTASITLDKAVEIASKQLGLPRDSHPATNAYIQLPSGTLAFTHQFQLRDDSQQRWVQVSVDAQNGQVVQVVDYVNEAATYTAIAFPKVNPLDGFSSASDNVNPTASPKGWHSDGSSSYTDTQ